MGLQTGYVSASGDQTASGAFEPASTFAVRAFLSGVDRALFKELGGRAQGVHVDAGALTLTDH